MRFGQLQQPHVGFEKSVIRWRHDLDCAGLPIPVFHDRDTKEDAGFRKLDLRHSPHGIPESMAMGLMSANLFTQSNGAHLQQTGGKLACRFRMSLGPTKHDDSIRLGSEAI